MILSTIDTMALGEIIGESSGKISGERVLDVKIPKVETSFALEGIYILPNTFNI
jgi:hypothetical protein